MRTARWKGNGNDANGDLSISNEPGHCDRAKAKVKRAVRVVGTTVDNNWRPDSSEDGSEDDTYTGSWTLAACIDEIEHIDSDSLTSDQRAAIRNLRAVSRRATSTSKDDDLRGASCRTLSRRDAKFFGTGRLNTKATLLIKDKVFLNCFQEVKEKKDTTCDRKAFTDVLKTYGGAEIFRSSISVRDMAETERTVDSTCDLANLRITDPSSNSNHDSEREGSIDITGESQRSQSQRRRSADPFIRPLEQSDFTDSNDHLFEQSEMSSSSKNFCPPEWNALNKKARTELTKLLSWENLSLWEFDILEVASLSREVLHSASLPLAGGQYCPLLLVGWAILCAPGAQNSMEGSLGDNQLRRATYSKSYPYSFGDDLQLDPQVVCNFLRIIEGLYESETENPYHNNVHAADVTQTLHCLLQFMDPEFLDLFDRVEIFSLLLAATFHDVCHPGTNNLYEKNALTTLALQYNDKSILENMHSAVGHSILMGGEGVLMNIVNEWEKKGEDDNEWEKKEEDDVRMDVDVDVHIFKKCSSCQIEKARHIMMSSVLGTDMSNHFDSMGELASLVEKVRANNLEDSSRTSSASDGEDQEQPILSILIEKLKDNKEDPSKKQYSLLANYLFKFLLHAADISNPTKPQKLALFWADKALKEFFAQGDKEKVKELPISPLCDRCTTTRPDSQIGFLKFVIRPCFALLGDIIPRVEKDVMPLIEENIEYWTEEKAKLSLKTVKGTTKALLKLTKSNRKLNKKDSIEEELSDVDVNVNDL